jgi:DNA-binding transcriptional ArsR family regulator
MISKKFQGGRVLRGLAQLRALDSSIRQEIVDSLQALGREASVSELAELVGAPADGLYYHLNALARAGLVRRRGSPPKGRGQARGKGRPEALYRLVGARHGLRLRYPRGGGPEAEATRRLVATMLRTANRDFARALARDDVTFDGAHRELWASREKGWLTRRNLARANALLVELCELWRAGRPGAGAKCYSLSFLLARVSMPRG